MSMKISDLAHRIAILERIIAEDLNPNDCADEANADIVEEIHKRLDMADAPPLLIEPAVWQWRYVGDPEWKTPSGGLKLTEEQLRRERPIEQRPLYPTVTDKLFETDETMRKVGER